MLYFVTIIIFIFIFISPVRFSFLIIIIIIFIKKVSAKHLTFSVVHEEILIQYFARSAQTLRFLLFSFKKNNSLNNFNCILVNYVWLRSGLPDERPLSMNLSKNCFENKFMLVATRSRLHFSMSYRFHERKVTKREKGRWNFINLFHVSPNPLASCTCSTSNDFLHNAPIDRPPRNIRLQLTKKTNKEQKTRIKINKNLP